MESPKRMTTSVRTGRIAIPGMIRPKAQLQRLASGYSTTMKYLERRALDLQGAE
jgi:hypothetical protein